MAAQFLTTSKLSNIVNMIALGKQSGILRVMRGQGTAREMGQIKFIDGEPAAALLGRLTSQNALSVLLNWGECIYSFDEQAITDIGEGDLGADGSRGSSDPRYSPTGSGSWPSYGYPSSTPTSSGSNFGGGPSTFPNNSPSISGPFPGSTNPGASIPNYPSQQGQPYGPASGYGATGSQGNWGYGQGRSGQTNVGGQFTRPEAQDLYATGALPSANVTSGQPNSPTTVAAPLRPDLLNAIAQRTSISESIEQLPLDRRERMVLLLVDGRRNLVDLARLTRRSEREILSVLEHLTGLGLVRF